MPVRLAPSHPAPEKPGSRLIPMQTSTTKLPNVAPPEAGSSALRASEIRYRRLFEAAQDGILILNAVTAQIEDVNPYLINMLGYSHEEFLGKKLWEVGPFADSAQSKEMFAELQTSGYVRYDDLPLKTKQGARIAVEFVSNAYDCDGTKVIQCNIRNVTERHIDRAKIYRHTQLYTALSQCNQAIVHSANEEELFTQICRIAVRLGGMAIAGVCAIDSKTRIVRPAASFGDDTGFLTSMELSLDPETAYGRGPTGTAMREDRIVWCQELLHDPATVPWQSGATRAGLAASASLPLHRGGHVVGAFTLYSGESNSFDELARDLLVEMAADISFALNNFEREARRMETEEEVRFQKTILVTQQETSLDAILVVSESGKIVSSNQQFTRLWKLPPQLVDAGLDAPVLQAVAEHVEDAQAFLAQVHYLVEHRNDKSRDEILLKDGRTIDRYSAPVIGADTKYYGRVWYFRDITERKRVAQELCESERRFSDLLGNVDLVSLMLDLDCRITYCNEYLLRLTGWRLEEVIGRDWFALFIAPELHHLRKSLIPAILAQKPEAMHDENEILTRSGERRLIRWNTSVLKSGAGNVIGLASIGEDITEHREAQARVAYLNRVYIVLSEINSLIVRVRDRDELFKEACRVAVDIAGFRMAMVCIVDRSSKMIVPVALSGVSQSLVSSISSILSSAELAPSTMMARAIKEKKLIVSNDSQSDPQVVFREKYVEAGVCSMVVLPLIVADEGIGALALYANEKNFFHEEELKLLTELAGHIAFAIDHIGKQEQLDYLAYYDVLTGLANRRLFLERVAQHMRIAASVGITMGLFLIDLERFKNVNESLGWSAGDALLRQVAEWLKRRFGDASLLARLGSDHFAVVLQEVGQGDDLGLLIEQTLEAFLNHPFQLTDSIFRVAVKGGAALFPKDGADAETVLRHAEAALKRAKTSGDKYLMYTARMTEASAGKLSLENQLRQALDNSEFVLHYQPKVNLATGAIVGAEALIRWNDPRTGLVPPGRFIPVLEETGLIHEVGRWALRQAIDDYLRWRAASLKVVRLSVNVSPLQLRHRDFISEVRRAIDIGAHAADGLELEITESLIMADVNHSIASLQEIRAMGVRIAIDDFGTGFSSLSYLARLPVDTLKIDRSFVVDMTSAPERLALVSTIIHLAHALKLEVVAEGVETDEQSRLLRLLDCDTMQGFLFSKPVPCEVFETRFLTQSPIV